MRGDDPRKRTNHRTHRTEFPACAGMIRVENSGAINFGRVPRMRGDDPMCFSDVYFCGKSSPHARG